MFLLEPPGVTNFKKHLFFIDDSGSDDEDGEKKTKINNNQMQMPGMMPMMPLPGMPLPFPPMPGLPPPLPGMPGIPPMPVPPGEDFLSLLY